MSLMHGPVPGTSIHIDYFSRSPSLEGRAIYFLTHFHSDHMAGLSEKWANGPLYCSELTARLLRLRKLVPRRLLHPRTIEQPFEVTEPLTQRVLTVTFLDACHCPGSVIIVLEGLPAGAVVHTGDFRYSESLERSAVLQRIASSQNLERLYLDVTWAHEAFSELPTKAESIAQLLDLIDKHGSEPILLHSHGLGDEELLVAVAGRFPTGLLLFTDRKRLEEVHLVEPRVAETGKFVAYNPKDPLHQQLARGGVCHVDEGGDRLPRRVCFVIRNWRDRRRCSLQGVEISCSTLWWAKAAHNHLGKVDGPIEKGGRWHILWAMHSSLQEIRRLIAWLSPRNVDPICGVICHEDSPTDVQSRFRDLLSGASPPRGIAANCRSPASFGRDSQRSLGSEAVDRLRRALRAEPSPLQCHQANQRGNVEQLSLTHLLADDLQHVEVAQLGAVAESCLQEASPQPLQAEPQQALMCPSTQPDDSSQSLVVDSLRDTPVAHACPDTLMDSEEDALRSRSPRRSRRKLLAATPVEISSDEESSLRPVCCNLADPQAVRLRLLTARLEARRGCTPSQRPRRARWRRLQGAAANDIGRGFSPRLAGKAKMT